MPEPRSPVNYGELADPPATKACKLRIGLCRGLMKAATSGRVLFADYARRAGPLCNTSDMPTDNQNDAHNNTLRKALYQFTGGIPSVRSNPRSTAQERVSIDEDDP